MLNSKKTLFMVVMSRMCKDQTVSPMKSQFCGYQKLTRPHTAQRPSMGLQRKWAFLGVATKSGLPIELDIGFPSKRKQD